MHSIEEYVSLYRSLSCTPEVEDPLFSQIGGEKRDDWKAADGTNFAPLFPVKLHMLSSLAVRWRSFEYAVQDNNSHIQLINVKFERYAIKIHNGHSELVGPIPRLSGPRGTEYDELETYHEHSSLPERWRPIYFHRAAHPDRVDWRDGFVVYMWFEIIGWDNNNRQTDLRIGQADSCLDHPSANCWRNPPNLNIPGEGPSRITCKLRVGRDYLDLVAFITLELSGQGITLLE